MFEPFLARTRSLSHTEGPVALDCARIAFVREGGADLFGEFGRRSIAFGDAVLIGPSVLCGAQPDGIFTYTTIALDMDYAIDQLFWRHSAFLKDRHDAEQFAARVYKDPFQILRLGDRLLLELAPALDEMVALSLADEIHLSFNRMQELWSRIANAIGPYIRVADVPLGRLDHRRIRGTRLAPRRFAPIRADVRAAASLLRAEPARPWVLEDLVAAVHLSRSQLSAVFADAFGRPPMAYLTVVRVEEMARLLRETATPVQEITHLVGWRSRNHAARMFRRLVGMNPSEYRRLRRVPRTQLSGRGRTTPEKRGSSS